MDLRSQFATFVVLIAFMKCFSMIDLLFREMCSSHGDYLSRIDGACERVPNSDQRVVVASLECDSDLSSADYHPKTIRVSTPC